MIYSMISLVGTFMPMFSYVITHIFCLAFLATVPHIIMSFFRR